MDIPLRQKRADVKAQLLVLLADADFEVLIGRATADRSRMFGRIRAFSERLEQLEIPTSYREALPTE